MKFHYKRVAAGLAIALGAGMAMQAAAADIQERRVKFSYPVSKTNPVGLATDKFIELVGQKTGGKIKVTGYADAQLGNEIQAMSSAQGGIIELTVVSTAGAANNVKELGIFDLPFLFHSVEEADAVIDGPVGKELLGKFAAKNLVGLCYWDYGFRQVSNSKHPINKVEDFDGLKLRVLQNRIYIDTFKALGANPAAALSRNLYRPGNQGDRRTGKRIPGDQEQRLPGNPEVHDGNQSCVPAGGRHGQQALLGSPEQGRAGHHPAIVR